MEISVVVTIISLLTSLAGILFALIAGMRHYSKMKKIDPETSIPPPPSECLAVPIINAGSTGPIITALTETMEKNPNIAFNIKFDNGDIIEVTTQNRQTQIALAALETVATRK